MCKTNRSEPYRRPDFRVAVICAEEPSRKAAGSMTYAEMRARPLARRADRMLRPARVLMRSRKPWVLARRRLLGWKVRFDISTALSGSR